VRSALIIAAAMILAASVPVNAQQRPSHKPTPPAAVPLQPPIPSSAEAQKPPQNESSTTQQPANPQQRGTEDRPVVVKVLPSEKTTEERAQEAADRSDKSSADWWLVRFALWIGVAAVGYKCGAGALSDTNSRDDTNRGATTHDGNSGNDCSRSTSTGPQPAVKRVLRQVETL
jgi:hypothetical protein